MERIPYDPQEAKITAHVPGFRPWMPPIPVFSPVVTPRENFLAFLRDEDPLWMPSSWDLKRFDPRIIPDNVAKGSVCDDRPFDPVKEGGGKDWFGIPWIYDAKAGGSLVDPQAHPVQDINEWESFVTLPDLNALDWEGCAAANRERLQDGKLTQMTVYTGLFERLMSFMGMTEAMVALIDEEQQEGVHRLFDYLCGFYDQLFARYKQYFDCDMLWFHDDWGSERAPFCSPATYREMIVPYLKRIVASCHKYGMFFEFHCCGRNEMLVPLMIECGVDTWHGQDMNDKVMLYEKYGDQIKLGIAPLGRKNMDMTAPPMSSEESREAFRRLLQTFDKGNVWVGMFMGACADASQILYEESRKAYEKEYPRR